MDSIRRTSYAFVLALATAALLAPFNAISADDPVNYDDPNLIVTNTFAGDIATTCPTDLAPSDLSRCLREKGLITPQGVALVPSMQLDPKAR